MAGEIIRNTRSVCPVCLRNLPAALRREEDGAVWLDKSCPAHGAFSVPVWRGRLDFASWIGEAEALGAGAGEHCPASCGRCAERCRQGAIRVVEGRATVDQQKCVFCGYCASACPQFCIKVV